MGISAKEKAAKKRRLEIALEPPPYLHDLADDMPPDPVIVPAEDLGFDPAPAPKRPAKPVKPKKR